MPDDAVETGPRPAVETAPAADDGERAGARISVAGLSKRFQRLGGEEVLAVDDVSLEVGAGEFVVLLGPSGCGKTTLLRCLAGLEHPEQGAIELEGRVVFSSASRVEVPPERRRISMMFQSYALWPHMTVFDNVAYPLRSRRDGHKRRGREQQTRERVMAALERVHCENLARQYPGNISGGQQQRIALARALVADDNVVLFDEPLSNVDAKVREELRFELITLQRKLGFSAVYVTHDQAEAMALADRLVLLRDGRIAQAGTPAEVYREPASEYVAQFLGTVNRLPGTLRRDDDGVAVDTAIGRVHVGAATGADGDEVVVTWRPESCRLSAERPDADNAWPVDLTSALFLGSHHEYLVEAEGVPLRVWRMEAARHLEGPAWLGVDRADLMVFPA